MKDLDDIMFSNKKEETKMAEKKNVRKSPAKKTKKDIFGIGIDIGTGWLVGASDNGSGVETLPLRDCFYSIDKEMFSRSMFNMKQVKYVEHNNRVYIVGEDALSLAKIQNGSALRPLAKGVINPNERAAAPILREMIRSCIQPFKKKDNETVVFSIPAPLANDGEGFNVEYHSLSLSSLIKSIGFNPVPLNEAYAVIISALRDADNVTGLGFSFGAGLVNVAFVYKGMSLFEFSINKSGDFIDQESSKACGVAESIINHIKEKKLDLTKDEFEVSPEERALIYTHRHVIKNTIKTVIDTFSASNTANIIEPIPIVISGGTTLPNGFIEMFDNELESVELPFEYSEVLIVKDKLTSVAEGCLIYANNLESK
jgi:actin-like ATPase involved in cell morphogenesis